jgi:hypothetical protein
MTNNSVLRFYDLPVDHFFMFDLPDSDGTAYQKLGKTKIRKAREHGIISYRQNQNVEDLGTNFKPPEVKKFKSLKVDDYFMFLNEQFVYRKVSATRARKLGEQKEIRYFKNEEVEFLGNDISQFTPPMLITTATAK